MSRLTDLNMPVLVRLGSIAVHAEEIIGQLRAELALDGRIPVVEVDLVAIQTCLADPDLQTWLKAMDAAALLPKKRRG